MLLCFIRHHRSMDFKLLMKIHQLRFEPFYVDHNHYTVEYIHNHYTVEYIHKHYTVEYIHNHYTVAYIHNHYTVECILT